MSHGRPPWTGTSGGVDKQITSAVGNHPVYCSGRVICRRSTPKGLLLAFRDEAGS
jgi:hypothetical protein